MDSEERAVDYAFEAHLSLPVAREVSRLIDEGATKFSDVDQVMKYVTEQVTEAFGRREQWAMDYAVSIYRQIGH